MKLDNFIDELKYAKKHFGNKDVKIITKHDNIEYINLIRYDENGIYIIL